jgi:hypothetical protein
MACTEDDISFPNNLDEYMDFDIFKVWAKCTSGKVLPLGQNGLIVARNLKSNIIELKLQKFAPCNIRILRWI